ncbi:MAG: c-type cytochrome [Polyangiaceae bacterium]
MKRALKIAGRIGAVLVGSVAAFAAYVAIDGVPRYAPPPIPELHVEATPERLARGKELVTLTCAACHTNAETHRMTGRFMSDLTDFGPVYSKNVTHHPDKGIGRMSDGELAVILRTGLKADGTYLPPWMVKFPHLSDEDLQSIIAFMRSDDPSVAADPTDPPGKSQPNFLGKVLAHTVLKPLPMPRGPITAPPRSDRVAYGRYMLVNLDCFSCHSPDFKTVNALEPEKTPGYLTGGNTLADGAGGKIHSANLTPDDETGIGRWSDADFVRALRRGFRPDGRMLGYPMEPRPALGEDEAAAIYSYLRTLAPVRNFVPRPAKPSETFSPDEPPGRRLFARYGCSTCHGQTGVGLGGAADLRRANEHFGTDAELRAYLDDPQARHPSTVMPPFKGIIRDEDYAPLMAHVRVLARDGRSAANP